MDNLPVTRQTAQPARTNPETTAQEARELLDAHARQLETFATKYMVDNGITLQLVEVVARELFGQQVAANGTVPEDVAKTPKELVSIAVNDIVDIQSGLFTETTITFDMDLLIEGAASLEFLVRYANKLHPSVMPVNVVPSDDIVAAALYLFHRGYAAAE
jgi:hypothetical protein